VGKLGRYRQKTESLFRWCVYFFSVCFSCFYRLHVGDTGYCSVFKKIGKKYGPFDVGLVPIGAYCPRYFMSPQHVDPKGMISYKNSTFFLPLTQ